MTCFLSKVLCRPYVPCLFLLPCAVDCVLKEPPVELIAAERLGVSHDDELHSRARYSHVHAPQIVKEAYLPLLV